MTERSAVDIVQLPRLRDQRAIALMSLVDARRGLGTHEERMRIYREACHCPNPEMLFKMADHLARELISREMNTEAH